MVSRTYVYGGLLQHCVKQEKGGMSVNRVVVNL